MNSLDDPEKLETSDVTVRTMHSTDLDSIVRIDADSTHRRRPEYFQLMLKRASNDTGLQVSLVAEVDGQAVGFILASIFYGEFGVAEPAATLDAVGVRRSFRGHHIAKAMMRQLRLNLAALRVMSIRSEVSWDDFELLAFFRSQGFKPSQRLCMEVTLDPTSPASETT